MRTTEQALDFTLGRKPAASRRNGFSSMVKTVLRMILERRSIARLTDLDEHQLLDIGLCRDDVRVALTSRFFDDAAGHLTQAARQRANSYYRDARQD